MLRYTDSSTKAAVRDAYKTKRNRRGCVVGKAGANRTLDAGVVMNRATMCLRTSKQTQYRNIARQDKPANSQYVSYVVGPRNPNLDGGVLSC